MAAICIFCGEEFTSQRGLPFCWACWEKVLEAFLEYANDEQKAMTEEDY